MDARQAEQRGKRVRTGIQHELDEVQAGLTRRSPDLEVDWIPLFGRIGAVASLYRIYYERFLAGSGLPHTDYQVLGLLRGLGARSPTLLARSVHQSTAGMTKTLDRLEGAGLIERRSHTVDRRRIEVALTQPGDRRTEALQRLELAAQQKFVSALDATTRKHLTPVLDTIIEGLAAGMPDDSSI